MVHTSHKLLFARASSLCERQVKLHINGVARKVLVDDRFPISRDGRIMTSHTTHNQELWVQIIEKAYMKAGRRKLRVASCARRVTRGVAELWVPNIGKAHMSAGRRSGRRALAVNSHLRRLTHWQAVLLATRTQGRTAGTYGH